MQTKNDTTKPETELEQESGEGCPGASCSLSFVVVAFRYGGNENVFPIGCFTTLDAAKSAAVAHRNYRGLKYDHRIYQFATDKWDDDVGHAVNRLPCIAANIVIK